MNLSEHFTLEEAITSETAIRLNIDNTPDEDMLAEITKTALFMESIRTTLGDHPIHVTSWYRCPALERVVAGYNKNGTTGHHVLGGAVDFVCPSHGSPMEVCETLSDHVDQLGIGQLIHEYGGWVHISRLPVIRPINRIITIDHEGVRAGIHAARHT